MVLKADIEYIFIVFEGAFNLEAITLLNSSLLILKNNLLCDVNRSLFTFNLYSFLNLIVRIILHTRVNSQFAGSLHLGLQILYERNSLCFKLGLESSRTLLGVDASNGWLLQNGEIHFLY